MTSLSKPKLVSVVIPAYNEALNLPALFERLDKVFKALVGRYEFECVLVDNGSHDTTWEIVTHQLQNYPWIRGVRLSRNFTAAGGITAGLHYAKGEAAIVMCADLQDPPERIPEFLDRWEQGYDVVYHIVSERKGVSVFYRFCSNIFHSLMSWLTNGAFPKNGSVYRLMDRKVYCAFNDLTETNRYFAGLCNWVGFKSVGFPFPREERHAGESKARLSVVVKLALDAIFAFSYAPLRLMSYLGLTLAVISSAYLVFVVGHALLRGNDASPGAVTILSVILLLFGAVFIALGLIGEYIARIYDEVKRRPTFIVKEVRS